MSWSKSEKGQEPRRTSRKEIEARIEKLIELAVKRGDPKKVAAQMKELSSLLSGHGTPSEADMAAMLQTIGDGIVLANHENRGLIRLLAPYLLGIAAGQVIPDGETAVSIGILMTQHQDRMDDRVKEATGVIYEAARKNTPQQ